MVQNWVNRIGYRVCNIGLEIVIELGLPLFNIMAPVEKQIIRVKEIIIEFKEMSL